jgi:hypothetical protein
MFDLIPLFIIFFTNCSKSPCKCVFLRVNSTLQVWTNFNTFSLFPLHIWEFYFWIFFWYLIQWNKLDWKKSFPFYQLGYVCNTSTYGITIFRMARFIKISHYWIIVRIIFLLMISKSYIKIQLYWCIYKDKRLNNQILKLMEELLASVSFLFGFSWNLMLQNDSNWIQWVINVY